MFTAAAIATAPVATDPLEIFEIALKFVPRRSRFYRIVADSLTMVHEASDWEDGYRASTANTRSSATARSIRRSAR